MGFGCLDPGLFMVEPRLTLIPAPGWPLSTQFVSLTGELMLRAPSTQMGQHVELCQGLDCCPMCPRITSEGQVLPQWLLAPPFQMIFRWVATSRDPGFMGKSPLWPYECFRAVWSLGTLRDLEQVTSPSGVKPPHLSKEDGKHFCLSKLLGR